MPESGVPIRLGDVADISMSKTPNNINRENASRRIVVQHNVGGRSLGLNLIYGFNGQFSLGQWGFYGIGAYTTAIVSLKFGLPFPVPLLLVVLCVSGMDGSLYGAATSGARRSSRSESPLPPRPAGRSSLCARPEGSGGTVRIPGGTTDKAPGQTYGEESCRGFEGV